MYERTYGKNYDANLDIKEIAKRVRKEIRRRVKVGELPELKASVRIERYSGGQSMRVEVKETSFDIHTEEYHRSEYENRPWFRPWSEAFTPTAAKVHKDLKALVDSYNHDGSDVMTDYFDVNFYGFVDFASELRYAEKDRYKAKFAAEEEASQQAPQDAEAEARWDALLGTQMRRPGATWSL